MRRYGSLILFAVVLIVPFLLRGAIGKSSPGKIAVEEDLRLILISPHTEGIRREFNDAFAAWHQARFGKPAMLDFRSYGGGGSDILRIFEASAGMYRQLGTYGYDVIWGGGDDLFNRQLRRLDVLEPVEIDPDLFARVFPSPSLGGVALYDLASDPPAWYGTALASFGIVYNKNVFDYLERPPPATWKDLRDPALRGWIALADPTRSASAKMAFMIIVERAMADAAIEGRSEDAGWADGMGLVRQIAANARLFTDSAGLVPSLVSQGNAAAGMAIDFYGRSQVDAVGDARMGYIEPVNATVINPDPIAVVKGAPHRELAVRFIEFVLSDAGQRLWNTRAGAAGGPAQTSLRRLPISPAVYADPRDFTDRVDPFTSNAGFNKSERREKTFGILGELIEASCMIPLEQLQRTRMAILTSPRAAELDRRLGTFPFDQGEALRRLDEWKRARPIERLKMQRRWTAEFREEYDQLRRMAQP